MKENVDTESAKKLMEETVRVPSWEFLIRDVFVSHLRGQLF